MRGWQLVRVRGRSMLPTYRDGDLLVVRTGAVPTPGSAAVVRLPPDAQGCPRPLSVKRIRRHEGPDGWWIDSDNAREGVTSFDVGPVPATDVVGVVRLRLPRLGRRKG